MPHKNSTLIFILFITGFSYSQVDLFGTVLNTNKHPIIGAHVLAIPVDNKDKMVFTTTDDEGNYEIILKKNKTYKLTFSHLSYVNFNQEISGTNNRIELNITLEDNVNLLEEIVITEQAPISMKKDTMTYKVSAFTTGKERKLRETLKKLPGLEVDKNGNVFINGKRITRLLVEGKEFFNGDTKLGVNNIPANVVDKVEIIEDYHDTAFLKGLETSEEVAMNIQLLANKKKFVFGDIEAGAGIEERYKLHPKVFKYAPKLALNFIGDMNNTFEKSFTLRDYINFEGGLNLENSSELFDSNIVNLLNNKNYVSNTHKFFGVNAHYNPNDLNEFRTFVIGLKDYSNYKSTNQLDYINENTVEERSQAKNNKTQLFLGKLVYNYTPNVETVLKTEISLEKNKIDALQQNTSNFFVTNPEFDKSSISDLTKFKSNISLDKKFNKNHISVINAELILNNNVDYRNYWSNTDIFSEEIPIVMDSFYSILQDVGHQNLNFQIYGKHYWVINRKNHLYFSIKNQFTDNDFNTNDYQKLSSTETVNFEDFNNNLNSQYNYFNSQFEYKRIFNDIIAGIKLRYEHHNLINVQQPINTNISDSNVIPELEINWDISSKKELTFSYTTNYRHSSFDKYATGRLIQGFYGVFTGNPNLDLSKSQYFRLVYSYSKSYGFSFFGYFNYGKNANIITNKYELSDIYTNIQPVQLDADNDNYVTRLRCTYNRPYWSVKYGLRHGFSNTYNFTNNVLLKTKRNSLSNDLDFATKFEDQPNIEINANYSFNYDKNGTFKNKQQRFTVATEIDYDYKDWKFASNYEFTDYKNEASSKSKAFFDNLSVSVFYNKEDSLWSFELKAYNLTNNTSNRSTNFGTIVINEAQTFIFPRHIMFSVIYKL